MAVDPVGIAVELFHILSEAKEMCKQRKHNIPLSQELQAFVQDLQTNTEELRMKAIDTCSDSATCALGHMAVDPVGIAVELFHILSEAKEMCKQRKHNIPLSQELQAFVQDLQTNTEELRMKAIDTCSDSATCALGGRGGPERKREIRAGAGHMAVDPVGIAVELFHILSEAKEMCKQRKHNIPLSQELQAFVQDLQTNTAELRMKAIDTCSDSATCALGELEG